MTQYGPDTQPSAQDFALIVGVGPGISASYARLFGENAMCVGVAARNPEKAASPSGLSRSGETMVACSIRTS
jgi:hypothetical protein